MESKQRIRREHEDSCHRYSSLLFRFPFHSWLHGTHERELVGTASMYLEFITILVAFIVTVPAGLDYLWRLSCFESVGRLPDFPLSEGERNEAERVGLLLLNSMRAPSR